MCNITADSSVILNICCFVRLQLQSQCGFWLVLELGLEITVSLALKKSCLGLGQKVLANKTANTETYYCNSIVDTVICAENFLRCLI